MMYQSPTSNSSCQEQSPKLANTRIPDVQQEQISQNQQQQQVLVRDLDSGVASCITLSSIPLALPVNIKRKSEAWANYWEQREHYKHALIKFVNNNEPEKLEDYLKENQREIDINDYVYMDGWSLLHHAVNKRYYNVILALINIGCDVNKVTQSMRRTALHLAVLQNNEDIVELLLTFGADPNIIDIDFCTPIHYAAQFGYIQIIKIFLENCQTINFAIKNNKKLSVIDCCKDVRIRNMIKQYCQIHQIRIESIVNQDRQVVDENHQLIYVTRTRSDLIQKILQNSNKTPTSCSSINIEQKESPILNDFPHSYPSLGSKINKHKFQKVTEMAKQSLISYRDSIMLNTTESLENYDIIRPLGSGTFGSVFLIRKKHSSKLFALKRLNKKTIIESKLKKYAYAQKQILRSIKHPFVVHGYSFFQDPLYLYMVIDFCAGGDLEKPIRQAKFSQEKAKKYCCQVVLALEQLHKHNYLFRDLKASNVLMDQSGHLKLSDFGLAKQTQLSHSFLGSIAYLAPQMLVQTDNKPHTAAIDWYLLGVFVFQMLVGLPPFYNQNKVAMFDQIRKDKPRLPSHLSPQCKDFILKTMAKRPNQRLGNKGAGEVKKHPWFKQIDWNVVLQRGLEMEKPDINLKELRSKAYMQQQDINLDVEDKNIFRGWDSSQMDKN